MVELRAWPSLKPLASSGQERRNFHTHFVVHITYTRTHKKNKDCSFRVDDSLKKKTVIVYSTIPARRGVVSPRPCVKSTAIIKFTTGGDYVNGERFQNLQINLLGKKGNGNCSFSWQ